MLCLHWPNQYLYIIGSNDMTSHVSSVNCNRKLCHDINTGFVQWISKSKPAKHNFFLKVKAYFAVPLLTYRMYCWSVSHSKEQNDYTFSNPSLLLMYVYVFMLVETLSDDNSSKGRNMREYKFLISGTNSQIARLMGPTLGPTGSCRPQMDPIFAPWTLLSGLFTL